jgi:NADPH:quinone reductase-like Zn-dependent oxidoreductase
MKAAILHKLGTAPQYGDFPDPIQQSDDQLLITIKAASVKNLDKGRASGAHYASYTNLPVVVGIDGVGLLADGTRVYATGISGMIAEKALINKHNYVKLPDHIDDATAAALPNAVMGAALALRFRAGIRPGEVVLINGATGVTGMVAIQIAKHYGAKRIIATGRNPESLKKLSELGADDILSLKESDEDFTKQLKKINTETPIDIVIDYTWGHPAELILSALKGGGAVLAVTHRVRFVTVGGMAGDNIQLSSGILRSSAIEILGSGLGSLPKEALQKMNSEILPEMFQLAADGKLKIETITMPLKDVESAWNSNMPTGQRLVIVM